MSISTDFLDEVDEFYVFLTTLEDHYWSKNTGFKEWKVRDIVGHLHFFDRISLLAVEDKEGFETKKKSMMSDFASGKTSEQLVEQSFNTLDSDRLMTQWIDTAQKLGEKLAKLEPKDRLPWFGPDMSVRMFTTARYMETWAHGQAIYDLTNIDRPQNDRIKSIATIGVKTFEWTFVNRKQEPPGDTPYVSLVAPSGKKWEWGEPNDSSCISGNAFEFCQVVTQVRNILDTSMRVTGDTAQQWMGIAQCFAGPPVDPPEKGQRVPKKRKKHDHI